MRRITALFIVSAVIMMTACSGKTEPVYDGITESVQLVYADQFTLDKLSDGCTLVTVGGSERYIIVPENVTAPEAVNGETVIQLPVEGLYLAASAAMDLFYGIEAEDSVCMTSTPASDWSLSYVKDDVENDVITYVGKYRSPDYEYILSEDCGLAIENTMIYHSPETKEKLEALGIPVMVERSSYESHPMGRLEWVKLFGLLVGKEEEAEAFFDEKNALFNEALTDNENGKTAAFFYISSSGMVNVRKPGDYISKMMELAGGRYIFNAEELKVDENALSTMNMQMELFYSKAKDADILIYNSTIDGEIETLDQLYDKDKMLKEFKAVKSGNVWCTEQNMFQQTTAMAEMTADMHRIFDGEADNTDSLTYLHRLK